MSFSSVTSTPGSAENVLPFVNGEAAAARTELEKILCSAALRDSDQLKRFLRYVVEETLAGHGELLKEYCLGVEVFERPAAFDPRIDPAVRMAARRLRQKLHEYYEGEGRHDSIRVEIPKGGYAAAFVKNAPPLETATEEAFAAKVPKPGTNLYWRKAGSIAALAFTLLAAFGASYLLYLRHVRSLQANNEMPSLAVLPFLNLTGNSDNDFISDGITEEITATMANAAGLRVVARTSAFQFKGKAENIREIGRRLNASSVLEGSIQSEKDRLRITAQLIRTSDGYHLWAETYDLPSKDRFAVEDEITRNLFRALNARLSAQADISAKKHATDPAAHELYLRGEYLRQHAGLSDLQKAITYFNQALDRDPLYAEAYAGLSAAYLSEGLNAVMPASEVAPKARAAALRSIELDRDLADAHVTLATLNFFFERNLPAAEQEFRRALELNPNSDRGHHLYGILLLCSRRFDEARVQYNLAKQVNPIAVQIDLNLIMLAGAERKYDEGIVLARKVLDENDNSLGHLLLGFLYADKKQYKDSIYEGEKGAALAPNDGDANLGLAILYARAGQRQKSQTLLHKILGGGVFIPPFTVAGVYAALGEKEEMYAWLNKAVEQHSPAVLRLNIAEPFDPYRSEARFKQIVAQVGLQSFQAGIP